MTSLSTAQLEPGASHSRLSASISSISSAQGNPNIAQTYKHAQSLFLTRRVQEALEAIEPLLRPAAAGDTPEAQSAPIATASRGARIKIWSLYCSVLNEVVEMGSDEGKQVFGAARWKELAAKARSGTVWGDVVRDGYNGSDGDVDAEVVATLATLLLAHAPSQKLTQHRLEDYLSATGTTIISPSSLNDALARPKPARASTNGTSTPRDLASRLKIFEIYTLHVLPRNEEWDYAREFISMSEILDEDRREAFLHALQSLQDENNIEARREAELTRQREMQLEDQRRAEKEKLEREAKKKKQEADVSAKRSQPASETPAKKVASKESSSEKPTKSTSSGQASSNKVTSQTRSSSGATQKAAAPGGVSAKRGPSTGPATVYSRVSSIFGGIQQMLTVVGGSLRSNPTLLLRFVAFLIAFSMALARRDVRDRLRGARNSAWDKVKSTVGMGVKVSYV